MQHLSAMRQSRSMFFRAIFEKGYLWAASAKTRPKDPRGRARLRGTALSQMYDRRQSRMPTTVHIKPARTISQYLETAGFNFSSDTLPPWFEFDLFGQHRRRRKIIGFANKFTLSWIGKHRQFLKKIKKQFLDRAFEPE